MALFEVFKNLLSARNIVRGADGSGILWISSKVSLADGFACKLFYFRAADSSNLPQIKWKFKSWAGKFAWSIKAKNCWALNILMAIVIVFWPYLLKPLNSGACRRITLGTLIYVCKYILSTYALTLMPAIWSKQVASKITLPQTIIGWK